ncbi:MAG: ABC transporter permease [Armatimonadota bacterium]|nr:ABC transporter permease [Armatimonadota bacterium]
MHLTAWGVILSGLLSTGISLAAPLLLAALGETIAEKSGVINVGIEGMILSGALAGFAVAFSSHNPWAGAGAALLAGVALAGLFAAVTIGLRADQVVVGTAINILALGLTGVFFRALPQLSGATAAGFAPLSFSWLHPAPGQPPSLTTQILAALIEQNALGYLAWALVPVVWLYLYKTRSGLRLRAVGEYPEAADGAGVRVGRVRVGATLAGGALAGLAGAYLSLGYTNGFVETMSAGRGFIALAVVILGRWNPFGVAAAALLFGLASALQFQFQAAGTRFPYQFFLALPYLLTLLALLGRSRLKATPPAALGEAYRRS